MKPRPILGDILRELRQERGLTQTVMANRLGHQQAWVSKLEDGSVDLHFLEARDVAWVLGLTFVEFVERVEKQLG